MGYVRSAPAFSFLGFDQLRRTVNLYPDSEDYAALRSKPHPSRKTIAGTLSMPLGEFAHELRARPSRLLLRISL